VDIFERHELRLARGEDMSPELVLDQAIDWGFERAQMVSRPGEAARRGDILDIFPPGYEKPLRLEFFGDTLEDIRLFDATSQRSLASLEEFRLACCPWPRWWAAATIATQQPAAGSCCARKASSTASRPPPWLAWPKAK